MQLFKIVQLWRSILPPERNYDVLARGVLKFFDQSPEGRTVRFRVVQSKQWDGVYKVVKFTYNGSRQKRISGELSELVTVQIIRKLSESV